MTLKLNGTNSVAAPAYAGDDADTGLQCGTNELKLVTGGTARFTVESDGDVTVEAGDCNLTDGNLVVAAGHGIDFSADGNAAGMTSELLDNYEEGTFTPNFRNVSAPTYTSQGGSYVKNGKIVLVTIDIQYTGLSRTDASAMSIGGLPFTSGTTDTGTAAGGGFCSGGSLMTFKPASHGETSAVYGNITGGTTALDILGLGNSNSFDYADCAEDGRIRMIATYISA